MEPDRHAVHRSLLAMFTTFVLMVDSLPTAAQLDRLRKFKHDPEAARSAQAPMVTIPAGEFWMGVDGLQGLDDERPRHKVRLDAYAMDL